MPRSRKSAKRASADAALHAVLKEQGRIIPRTAAEVAEFEIRHGKETAGLPAPAAAPAPLLSWEAERQPVPFPVALEPDAPLAYAARKQSAVSPETRSKLARLVAKMKAAPRRRA